MVWWQCALSWCYSSCCISCNTRWLSPEESDHLSGNKGRLLDSTFWSHLTLLWFLSWGGTFLIITDTIYTTLKINCNTFLLWALDKCRIKTLEHLSLILWVTQVCYLLGVLCGLFFQHFSHWSVVVFLSLLHLVINSFSWFWSRIIPSLFFPASLYDPRTSEKMIFFLD